MDFRNAYAQGFARIAACTVPVADFDPAANAARIADLARQCDVRGTAVALFPELSVSGYAIDDLLLQDSLLDAVDDAVTSLIDVSRSLRPMLVVGAPVRLGNRLYNCAVVVHRGRVLGIVPKSFVPNYREFYEKRHFAQGHACPIEQVTIPAWGSEPIAVGTDLIFTAEDVPGLEVHVEICEDLWVPVAPSDRAGLAGATVLLNLSASPITIGKAETRHLLARASSERNLAVYAYAAAMFGESTTDLSWDGMTMIYELGALLTASERFPESSRVSLADIDLDALRQERMRQGSFDDCRVALGAPAFRRIGFCVDPPAGDIGLERAVDRFPFVPGDPARLAQDCYEGYNIQVSGLERRMVAIGGGDPAKAPRLCIGVSGGLDSTHALIVAAKATDRLGLPRTHILAYTMPGFATTDHTRSNAEKLCRALGVTFETVDIRPLATQMLDDLGHPYSDGNDVYDVTFENVQAGLRYDLLFRAANHRGGIVVGTGDLSELALGWCTYGVGDQMSHYGVNAGVPKTLIQHLIRWVMASGQFDEAVNGVLTSILGTEITPELIPTRPGEQPQSTQATIGPYELQDFTLFHLLRRGARPRRIAFLAEQAWGDVSQGVWPSGYPDDERRSYDLATIRGWLEVFVRRFTSHQFKRSALPNGPKVVAGGTLSPRGDWRMPSDVSARVWQAEIDLDVPRA
ncbi:MAG: NAD(+) synthase [Arachnia sp.]